jgi:hypothetical protein
MSNQSKIKNLKRKIKRYDEENKKLKKIVLQAQKAMQVAKVNSKKAKDENSKAAFRAEMEKQNALIDKSWEKANRIILDRRNAEQELKALGE